MLINEVKDWVASIVDLSDCWVGVGRITTKTEKAICFYPYSGRAARDVLGGKANEGYTYNDYKILVHYGVNLPACQTLAETIYESLKSAQFEHVSFSCWTEMHQQYPVYLGSDENGIYEYVINFTIYENK